VPTDAIQPLTKTGQWIRRNAETVYGRKARNYEITVALNNVTRSVVSLDHKTVYAWNFIWPNNGTMNFGGLKTVPKRITYLESGEEIAFKVYDYRLELSGLPPVPPDKDGVTVLKLEFDEEPVSAFGCYYPQMTNGVDKSDGKGNP